MKRCLLFFIFFYSLSWGCQFEDLTDKAKAVERKKINDKVKNPGARVAWENMKLMNKLYYTGTVDQVVHSFESRLCKHFNRSEFKKRYPDVKISIKKMDFKGYYATCSPESACTKFSFEEEFKRVNPPEFPRTHRNPEKRTFPFSVSSAQNYQEGYVRTRVRAAYPDYDGKKPPLEQFIKSKLDEAIKEATGAKAVQEVMLDDRSFKNKLRKNLELSRADDFDKVAPTFKKLVKALDSLVEIPYVNSHHFEEELSKALEVRPELKQSKKVFIMSAQSGDDMNLIIRRGNDVVKVVGADAKGLGILNMMTRFDQYLKFVKSGEQINEMKDVFMISSKASEQADKVMNSSMQTYKNTLEQAIGLMGDQDLNLDQKMRLSHDFYNSLYESMPDKLMQMRAGALDLCGHDIKCLQDKITVIHNSLKQMEKAGIHGFFGDSCIGLEFWSRKLKVKDTFTID